MARIVFGAAGAELENRQIASRILTVRCSETNRRGVISVLLKKGPREKIESTQKPTKVLSSFPVVLASVVSKMLDRSQTRAYNESRCGLWKKPLNVNKSSKVFTLITTSENCRHRA